MEYLNIFFIDFPSSINPVGCQCSSDPALKSNKIYLHLCSEDEQRAYGVGTAWG